MNAVFFRAWTSTARFQGTRSRTAIVLPYSLYGGHACDHIAETLFITCSDLTEATVAGASISLIAAVTIVALLVLVSPAFYYTCLGCTSPSDWPSRDGNAKRSSCPATHSEVVLQEGPSCDRTVNGHSKSPEHIAFHPYNVFTLYVLEESCTLAMECPARRGPTVKPFQVLIE